MTHPTQLILGALSGASLSVPFAYAAPQSQAPAEEATTQEAAACACTCATCLAKHGPKATTVVDTLAQESAEIDAVREALAAVEVQMARERQVAEVLGTELRGIDSILLDTIVEEDPIIVDVDVVEDFFVGSETSEGGSFTFATPVAPVSSDQGYLGVELGEGDDGVEIAGVMPGSPAQDSGVQAGDVIFNIAGTTVMDLAGLRETMQRFKPGDTVGFGVMRNGRPVNLTAKLADRSVIGGASVPQVGGNIRVVPAVPPAPAVRAEPAGPAAPRRIERIRLLPNPEEEAMQTTVVEVIEEEPEMAGRVEVILAEPVRLPTMALEARPTQERKAVLRWVGQAPKPVAKAEAGSKAKSEAADALPNGYIEITTRRERRPAGADALQARIDALEAEVAELSQMLADIRRELNRRNPR